MLKEFIADYCRFSKKLETDLKWAHQVMKEQCNDELIVKLQTYDSYDQVDADADPIKLLYIIQRVCFKYQNDKIPIISSYYHSLQTLYSMKQKNRESMIDISNSFTDQIDVVATCKGSIIIKLLGAPKREQSSASKRAQHRPTSTDRPIMSTRKPTFKSTYPSLLKPIDTSIQALIKSISRLLS